MTSYESLTCHMFDLDGTLIRSYMDRPDKNFAAVELLPGVAERWAHLRSTTGNNLAIITNQAGVAFGYNSEADVQRKLCAVGAALGYGWIELHDGSAEPIELDTNARKVAGVLRVYVCYTHPKASIEQYRDDVLTSDRRKPSPAMIHEAYQKEGYTQFGLFVGDSSEDEKAARNAGIAFQWAEEFFHA